MNEDKLAGEGRDIVGKVKETAGDFTGNTSLQGEGLIDQVSGKMQKVVGVARDALDDEREPLMDQALRFARGRPYVTAAVAFIAGVAFFNAIRGKR